MSGRGRVGADTVPVARALPGCRTLNVGRFQSTTVLRYAGGSSVPVSCSLSELEVFSCVLGLEEETALSIIDPAAVQLTLHADRTLHVRTPGDAGRWTQLHPPPYSFLEIMFLFKQ